MSHYTEMSCITVDDVKFTFLANGCGIVEPAGPYSATGETAQKHIQFSSTTENLSAETDQVVSNYSPTFLESLLFGPRG